MNNKLGRSSADIKEKNSFKNLMKNRKKNGLKYEEIK